jgi:hypothetical protein
MVHKRPDKIAILTPFKIRHRYFVKILLSRHVKIECIVIPQTDHNLFLKIRLFFSISNFLDLLITFYELFSVGMLKTIKSNIIKIDNYMEILKPELTSLNNIDVFLIYGGPVIPNKVLSNQKSVFINVHGALLPGYRGLDSHWWMFLERNTSSQGYAIHLVDSGIDSGGILKTRKFDSKVLSLTRILSWRLWIAENSAKDISIILKNRSYGNFIVHDLNSSVYKSKFSLRNIFRNSLIRKMQDH